MNLFALFGAVTLACQSAASETPDFFGTRERSATQPSAAREGFQFVAALDDPPFSFLDGSAKLNGFSVYLARAICEELNSSDNCIISGRVSADLALTSGTDPSSTIISNAAASTLTREKYQFTKPFLRIPGRFVRRNDASAPFDFERGLAGVKIGVAANSAEERMLRSYFPEAAVTGYADKSLLLKEVSDGKIELAFGDGLNLATWLASEDGKSCCAFEGRPYYSSYFLGEGVRFAVPAANGSLAAQIDSALVSLQQKGKIEELFLRFFPVNFY